MFDGMIFQKKYSQAKGETDTNALLDSVCSQFAGNEHESRKDRDRVNKLFSVLNGDKLSFSTFNDGSDR
jgi:inhibitor of KinA sporulation pathway (predicted exonuclease)